MKTTGSISADWIVPVTSEPRKNACLGFEAGKIKGISHNEREGDKSDSTTVIIPGLINLHSHLDYSALDLMKLPLFQWIPNLVKETRNWSPEEFEHSASFGVSNSIKNGTTFLVDSSYSGASAKAIVKAGLRAIVGLEIFGIEEDKSGQIFEYWLNKFKILSQELEKLDCNGQELVELTVSPHSPYTVSPSLFKKCKNWCTSNKKILLTHLAESKNEQDWFQKDDQALNQFLETVLPPNKEKTNRQIVEGISWKAQGKSSVEALKENQIIDQYTLAAHCVHLTQKDIEILASSGTRVAHCPRSNTNLSNGRAPVEKLIASQINFGLGTDSSGSTESLSMLDECRYMQTIHQSTQSFLNCQEALRLITIESAKQISMEHKIGSLENGKFADFVVLRIPNRRDKAIDVTNIYDHILSDKAKVSDVFVNGVQLLQNSKLTNQSSLADF